MKQERCSNCVYFAQSPRQPSQGQCKLNPPKNVHKEFSNRFLMEYIIVCRNWECGHYKEKK